MINMLGVYVDEDDVTDIFTGSAFLDSGYSCLILTKSKSLFNIIRLIWIHMGKVFQISL